MADIKLEYLEETVRRLPGFMPEQIGFWHVNALPKVLQQLRRKWPKLVQEPIPLLQTLEGRWIQALAVGQGENASVVNVYMHGGEPLWSAGSIQYIRFLCRNPHLLEGRTVYFLFAGLDEAARNMDSWVPFDSETESLYIIGSLVGHARNIEPLMNDNWSWPAQRGPEFVNQPTVSTRAAMMLIDIIMGRGQRLLAWCDGHNKHIGPGAHYWISGPNEAESALVIERISEELGVGLDHGPQEDPYLRRHPGTVASTVFGSVREWFEFDPTVKVGGSVRDYLDHPDRETGTVTLACEVPMLVPARPGPWDRGMTRAEADAKVAEVLEKLAEATEPALEIMFALEHVDLDVEAARSITARAGWGTRRIDPGPPDRVLHPHEAMYIMLLPAYAARRSAPAMTALIEYKPAVVDMIGIDRYNEITAGLEVALLWAVGMTHKRFKRPEALGPSLSAQILALEVATYAAADIQLRDFPIHA